MNYYAFFDTINFTGFLPFWTQLCCNYKKTRTKAAILSRRQLDPGNGQLIEGGGGRRIDRLPPLPEGVWR
jgi:hypothetical protein